MRVMATHPSGKGAQRILPPARLRWPGGSAVGRGERGGWEYHPSMGEGERRWAEPGMFHGDLRGPAMY